MPTRAAVLGATAHVAGKRGAARAQEQAAGAPGVEPTTPSPTPTAAVSEDPYAELEKIKELLDQGIITEAEFNVQKQKILGRM
jgi:hypothetical protein